MWQFNFEFCKLYLNLFNVNTPNFNIEVKDKIQGDPV